MSAPQPPSGYKLPRTGPGSRFTDLERARLDYWVKRTRLDTAQMAERLGRSRAAVSNHLLRRGISVRDIRCGEGEDGWAK